MTNALDKCPKMHEGHLTCTTLQYYIDYIDKDLLEPRFLHFPPQRYPRGCPWTLLLVWGPMFGTQNSLFISTTHVRNTSRPPPQNPWGLWKVNLIMCKQDISGTQAPGWLFTRRIFPAPWAAKGLISFSAYFTLQVFYNHFPTQTQKDSIRELCKT